MRERAQLSRSSSCHRNIVHPHNSPFRMATTSLVVLLLAIVTGVRTALNNDNKQLDWIVGKWRSEFGGKVFWPTVPTMTYGEEMIIEEAPMARASNVQFLNFSARAWSHSTKDHFHDEWGFLTFDSASGNATLMTAGNNGFTTYEVGPVTPNRMQLVLKDIGRISFSRDLPVEDLRRTFIKHDEQYLEQILEMRTATHPHIGYLEHARVIYTKVV